MTKPTSMSMSFDTSVIDLANMSFSTTASDPSDQAQKQRPPNIIPTTEMTNAKQPQPNSSQIENSIAKKPSTPIIHLPTQETYDQWASTYDTDGNILQSIDDLELATLLPEILTTTTNQFPASTTAALQILDLGCGTARNTKKLLCWDAYLPNTTIKITGLDFSAQMLEIANDKLNQVFQDVQSKHKERNVHITYRLVQADCFPTIPPSSSTQTTQTSPIPNIPLPKTIAPSSFHLIISTLVLEHIPLKSFFATLTTLMAHHSLALITNMHQDMGRISQAGFVDAEGIKVRGESLVHELQHVVQEAGRRGLAVEGCWERGVEEGDLGGLGVRGKKWVGKKVWWGVALRKGEGGGT